MKKTLLMIVAAAAVAFGVFSCAKPYDDSELRDKISGLDARISKLEGYEAQIQALQATVDALYKGVSVKNVEQTADGLKIVFSDGTSANLPVNSIGVTEVDGVYCWTINGAVAKDPAGNVIPVGTQAPQLRAAEDGTLEYSVDGGKHWNPLAGKTEAPTMEETDEAYIIHFGENTLTLPKESAFYIHFAVASNFSIAYGETGEAKFDIKGGGLTEDIEMGILAIDEGFEVELVPAEDNNGGLLKITNNNKTATSGRVIVYAANHKGKSDIKTFVFQTEPSAEPAEFEAEIEGGVEEIPAAGGTFYLSVKADEDYDIAADVDWITVDKPTRALYEDNLKVVVEENTIAEPRTGTITLTSKESDLLFAIEVKQEAGEPEPVIPDYKEATGIYMIEGHGLHDYVSGSKLVVEDDADVSYYAVIWPSEDGAEDNYPGAILYVDGEDLKVQCYLDFVRDEETGALAIMCGINDEWEHSSAGTIDDWQTGAGYIGDEFYWFISEETYPICISEGPEDGVMTFEPTSLQFEDVDDPVEIKCLDVVAVIVSSDGVGAIWASMPLPATFTKIAELEDEEEETTSLSLRSRKMIRHHAERVIHEFTPVNLQMYMMR